MTVDVLENKMHKFIKEKWEIVQKKRVHFGSLFIYSLQGLVSHYWVTCFQFYWHLHRLEEAD